MSYYQNNIRYPILDWNVINNSFFIGYGKDEGFYRMYTNLYIDGRTRAKYIITDLPIPNVKIDGYNSNNDLIKENVEVYTNPVVKNDYLAYNGDMSLFVKDEKRYFSSSPIGITPKKYTGQLSGYSDDFYSGTSIQKPIINYNYSLTSGSVACDYAYVNLNFYFEKLYVCENTNGLGKYVNINDESDFRYFGEQFYTDNNNVIWHKTTSNDIETLEKFIPTGVILQSPYLLNDTSILSSSIGIMIKQNNTWKYFNSNLDHNSYWSPGVNEQITPDNSPITLNYYENNSINSEVQPLMLTFKEWKDYKYGTPNTVYYTIPNTW